MRATPVALLALLLIAAAARAAAHPLSDAKVQVKYADPLKQTLKLSGRWLGALPAGTPFTGATLRVGGAFGYRSHRYAGGFVAGIHLYAARRRTTHNDAEPAAKARGEGGCA